jgi:hypothetical protein
MYSKVYPVRRPWIQPDSWNMAFRLKSDLNLNKKIWMWRYRITIYEAEKVKSLLCYGIDCVL